ncbi:transcriptional regulator [Marispirochaeta sp.]|uniref:transcriptional regulator n=1 Tax=Marispirochaeta sp. TaxID=2038653 RepID=UPI0029C8CD12|nr:transcriptional regulator [Marispirochaeta sp.]
MKHFIAQKAQEDFNKAKGKATLGMILNYLSPERQELLSLQDVRNLLRPKGESYQGMKTVSLDRIIGSEGRYKDFNKAFLPRHEHIRNRWQSIDRAHISDVILPPIKLYEIGGVYFVRDGNHRVSVARHQGVYAIDAEVTSLTTEINLDPKMTIQDLKKAIIDYEKQDVFINSELGRIISPHELSFTETGRFVELLRHIQGHKYFMNLDKKEEIPFVEAGKSWYRNLYKPIIGIIKTEKIHKRFPGRTPSDLYMWIIKHWHELKEKYGDDFAIEEAARNYSRAFGTSWKQNILNFLFQRKSE